MATEATARKFFSAANFAVVGASSNTAKYGHKGTYLPTAVVVASRLLPQPHKQKLPENEH